MTRGTLRRAGLLLLCLALWLPSRAQEPVAGARIRDLRASLKDRTLSVSFRVDGAFSPEIRERLASAAAVTFVHRIRVFHRRGLWFGRLLAERTVQATVSYDNLTRQYSLSRTVDGVEVGSQRTESEPQMEKFMTEVRDISVAGPEALSGERRVSLRVRSEYEDTWLLFLFPWTYAAVAEREVDLR